MYEHAGQFFEGLVDKTNYYLRDLVAIVKQLLAIVVLPKESHVPDAIVAKNIWKLVASRVHNVSYVVFLDEPKVFRAVFVPQKYAVNHSRESGEIADVKFTLHLKFKSPQ